MSDSDHHYMFSTPFVSSGQVISALREKGLLANTVLIFTADHGELAMEHRQFYKMSMFEGSSRVPLLIMGPGLKSGLQVHQLVSLVDLYPTVLGRKEEKPVLSLANSRRTFSAFELFVCFTEIAGISAVGNLSGHSVLPLISTSRNVSKNEHPEWVLSEYHGCNANASTYMLRVGHWKYIAYADGISVPPQLFSEFFSHANYFTYFS